MQPDTTPSIPPRGLLGNRMTLGDIQAALEQDLGEKPCERTVRNELERLRVSFVKVCNKLLYDPAEVRERLLQREVNRAPRGRGRPRNAA